MDRMARSAPMRQAAPTAASLRNAGEARRPTKEEPKWKKRFQRNKTTRDRAVAAGEPMIARQTSERGRGGRQRKQTPLIKSQEGTTVLLWVTHPSSRCPIDGLLYS
ncbi:hypothetical protein BHM03_00021505 [Ensete ventricosum]|uniref:Uncharacterized protein n=1 Tax=Ensete ventricosum TaxID=4639 RepID=A0A445MG19_ENSVE|nr:hypothetical protein BHM03_00021505 [Ensete ventricosum]